MILLVGSFIESHEERMGEYVDCLERNIANPFIESIHVFIEQDIELYLRTLSQPPSLATARLATALSDEKVSKIVRHGERTTYAEFFRYANTHLPGRLVCISNADIYFDETLGVLNGVDLAGVLICLGKYDQGKLVYAPQKSQDSWIFVPPVISFLCDWSLGVAFCETRLSFEAARAGLKLANPCYSVIAHHQHMSGLRRWSRDPAVPGEYTDYLEATGIEALKKRI